MLRGENGVVMQARMRNHGYEDNTDLARGRYASVSSQQTQAWQMADMQD